jgi:hypothetical protein
VFFAVGCGASSGDTEAVFMPAAEMPLTRWKT